VEMSWCSSVGLHIPTFLRQCADLWALPQDAVVHEIALPFVGLYFTVCTVRLHPAASIAPLPHRLLCVADILQLGMQFMETSEVAKHFTPEEAETLPDLWFNAARSVRPLFHAFVPSFWRHARGLEAKQGAVTTKLIVADHLQALWAADFMGTHTTEGLQCLILLGVFMVRLATREAVWLWLIYPEQPGSGRSRVGTPGRCHQGELLIPSVVTPSVACSGRQWFDVC
jgi:hypothetical protein